MGGGFLLTPLLIFIGIPPAVAVATQANQVVASSVSGVLAHWSRDNVDFKMGVVLLVGGIFGSTVGVGLFSLLSHFGQVDLVIRLFYVFFLGFIGILDARRERALRSGAGAGASARRASCISIPGSTACRSRCASASRGSISARCCRSAIGFFVGILSAIMGVGGAFIMVPAMIYLLGMPTLVVVGTSLFQIIFVAANVTFLQSVQNQTVDVVLALVLTVGGVIGAQIGGRVGAKLPASSCACCSRSSSSAVAIRLAYELGATPADLYSAVWLSPES